MTRAQLLRRVRALGASGVVLASACGGSDGGIVPTETPPTSSTAVVSTPGNTFSPPFTTIAVGTAVRFEIRGAAHNVIFSGAGAPANINVVSNTDVTRTFAAKGTFPYDCTVHPGMSGEVLVQ
jgi:plastocyanin